MPDFKVYTKVAGKLRRSSEMYDTLTEAEKLAREYRKRQMTCLISIQGGKS